MAWHFEAASQIGARPEQQDRVEVLTAADGAARLAVLADGLGGHSDGAAAAQAVVDIARQQLAEIPVTDPQAFLTDLCRQADTAIAQLGRNRHSNPASTCVLLYARDKEAYWVHVGDSRLYHFRGDELLSRTQDHSVAEIRSNVSHGQVPASGANTAGNQLYMCLGGQNDLIPEFGATAVGDGDWFMLCSDGFWSQIRPEETSRAFLESDRDHSTAAKLTRLATRRAGSQSDNVSLVLAAHYPKPLFAPWRHFGRLFSSVRARWG